MYFWHIYMAHECIEECAGCAFSHIILKMGKRVVVCRTGNDPKTLIYKGICRHLQKNVCPPEFFCQECKTCAKNK